MGLKQNFFLKSTRIWRVVIMRHICIAFLVAVMTPGVNATEQFIAFKPAEGYQRIDLANAGILVDNKEDKAIHHAVDNLKEDIARAASSRLPKMGGESLNSHRYGQLTAYKEIYQAGGDKRE